MSNGNQDPNAPPPPSMAPGLGTIGGAPSPERTPVPQQEEPAVPPEVSSPPPQAAQSPILGGNDSRNSDALSGIIAGRPPAAPSGPPIAPSPSPPITTQTRADISGKDPATIRYNNPSGMFEGPSSRKFGASTYGVLKDGNHIAKFGNAEDGAAAQFDLLNSPIYINRPVQDVISKWSGKTGGAKNVAAYVKATGLPANTLITPELLQSPAGIALAKHQAAWETGREYPLSDEQWQNAQQRAFGSTPPMPATPVQTFAKGGFVQPIEDDEDDPAYHFPP